MILGKTQWRSDQNAVKLCYAALIHDIALKNQELAQLDTMAEFEKRKAEFTPEDQKVMLYHTVRAAERVRSFDAIPPDVDTICIQHHERPDGSGFPRKLKYPQITALSAVFIVAHEYVSFSHRRGGNASMEDFLSEMDAFHLGHFVEVLEAIRFE